MYNLYKCKSKNKGLGYVYFSREGDGWKIDVQNINGDWIYGMGDQFETSIDEIFPYLKLFTDETCVWTEDATEQTISFWNILEKNTRTSDL